MIGALKGVDGVIDVERLGNQVQVNSNGRNLSWSEAEEPKRRRFLALLCLCGKSDFQVQLPIVLLRITSLARTMEQIHTTGAHKQSGPIHRPLSWKASSLHRVRLRLTGNHGGHGRYSRSNAARFDQPSSGIGLPGPGLIEW